MQISNRIVSALTYLIFPILGLLFFGWDWRSIVLLYWLENITAGLLTFIKILRTQDSRRGLIAAFFVVHFGIFTLVHGVFVMLIIGDFFQLFFSPSFGFGPVQLFSYTLDFGLILGGWAIGTVIQILISVFTDKPEANLSAQQVMFSPYSRIFVLHFSILIAVGLIIVFNWPAVAAYILIALHALFDFFPVKFGSGNLNQRTTIRFNGREL